jgi:hypothetical protein
MGHKPTIPRLGCFRRRFCQRYPASQLIADIASARRSIRGHDRHREQGHSQTGFEINSRCRCAMTFTAMLKLLEVEMRSVAITHTVFALAMPGCSKAPSAPPTPVSREMREDSAVIALYDRRPRWALGLLTLTRSAAALEKPTCTPYTIHIDVIGMVRLCQIVCANSGPSCPIPRKSRSILAMSISATSI